MIDRKQFEKLAQIEGKHCISFFLPTHRAGQEQEDRIRYKNALKEVRNGLEEQGLAPREVESLLKNAGEKLDDEQFWLHQSDGLAVFIDNGQTEFFELPIRFSQRVYIGNRLYLKPVIPMLTGDAKFFLLAISQNETKFYVGERYAITEIETSKYLPRNMQQMMQYIQSENQLQHHSGQGTQDAAIFHGQGGSKEMDKTRLREYMRLINKGVMDMMCKDDNEPLILATTEENAGIYREVNEYHNLHEAFIPGNPEDVDPAFLHEQAWELMRPKVEAAIEQDRKQFEPALSKDEASFTLHDIVPAAIAGRVKTLFVAEEDEIWGTYDPSDHSVTIHESRTAKSMPLLDRAAVQSVLNGGTVYVLPRTELPRPTGSLNAVYRYANVTA